MSTPSMDSRRGSAHGPGCQEKCGFPGCDQAATGDVAVAESAMAIDRERRVVGNVVVKIESTEPSISSVQFDFLAQLPLKADAIAVAHDQHPDRQLGVDRRPAEAAIEGLQLLAQSPSAADSFKPTESLFAENHEPFFDSIGHKMG